METKTDISLEKKRRKNNEATKKYHEAHKEQYREYYRQKYLRERDIYVARNRRNYLERKQRKLEAEASVKTDKTI